MIKHYADFRHLLISFAIHLIFFFGIYISGQNSITSKNFTMQIQLEDVLQVSAPETKQSKIGLSSNRSKQKRTTKIQSHAVDFRPDFAKDGIRSYTNPIQESNTKTLGAASGIQNESTQRMLFTESKVTNAFDELAAKLNGHLSYPSILVENGVSGVATLDLYFNSSGLIDESKSEIFGPNSSIRGLLTRAARKAIADWFNSEAIQLERSQFSDQHFRAEFVLSSVNKSISSVSKLTFNRYRILRRKYKNNVCVGSFGSTPTVDVTCIAMRIAGEIRSRTSHSYREQLDGLKDQLKFFDSLGLKGINKLI